MLSGRFALGALTGAAAMYFLDPQRGHRRRAQANAKLRSRVRHTRRDVARRARDRAQRKHGEELRQQGAGRFHAVDDRSLADHLHQMLTELHVPTRDITVEVVDGVVRLRGQVPTVPDINVVVGAVAGEPGVDRVDSYLHLPHEPAPNKAAALAVSHTPAPDPCDSGKPARRIWQGVRDERSDQQRLGNRR